MGTNIKKNFFYNLILTLSGYIFPLLTYPYASRILGVDSIGVCNYIDSIITYYILFSTLGIGSYGVRKIAQCQDNEERNEVFSNLFIFHATTTIIALIILFFSVYTFEELYSYKSFFGIGAIKILFTLFLTNWFFQGICDFKYITKRTILVNCIYTILIFVFVKKSNDVISYYALSALTLALNATINWFYGRKFRKISFKCFNLRKYLIPICSFGLYNILTSMYTTFNVVYLGVTSGSREVGYFTTATKLYVIIMGLFTAFTTVMVPAVSKILKEESYDRLNQVFIETIELIIVFSIPIIIFCELNAEEIIFLLSGTGYEGAIIPFRIVIILLLIIGFEQILIQQFLMAKASSKDIFIVSFTGAITGILLNLYMTPRLAAVGSAISWGGAEFMVLLVGTLILKKTICLSLNMRPILKKCFYSILYIIPWGGLFFEVRGDFIFIISAFFTLFVFAFINLFIDKNKHIVEMWNKVMGSKYYIKSI